MHRGWGIKGKVRELLTPYLGEDFVLEFPPSKELGDLSTPLPLVVAQREKRDPIKIAEELKGRFDDACFEAVTISRPGYLNFQLKRDFLLEELMAYHQLQFGLPPRAGRVLIEFVSVNPTGPINVVNGRAAVLGDILVRTFNFVGFQAESEFYINDAGRQAELLAQSILARVDELKGKPLKIPEDGYSGEYLKPIAEKFLKSGEDIDVELARRFGVAEMVKIQKETLARFNVHFDHWISEKALYDEGRIDQIIEALSPHTFEEDGALWFKANGFGDEKPRVLRTSDGRYTYIVPDLAYHLFKFERGFDLLIDIWGPDHHGYIPKIKAGLQALGVAAERLEVLIAQQVNLKSKDGRIAMSKRAGRFVTLDELLDEIPVDVVRFFFLMRSPSQPLDFDLDLAREHSEKNPVYYVQYGHARISSIIKHARNKGFSDWSSADLSLLDKSEERDLIIEVLKFPDVVLGVVDKLEPQKLVYYLIGLATVFHYFYERHRVVSSDSGVTKARLYLVETVGKIIRKGLELLGVNAPEEM
ncbi:MAG TPA: arginine--tRNA ligase [bacterium (Candidatus Stahlbacteria)]|nr:arginine--tRNA ligase [Candidatus Stahlbacteria bacterium]